MTNQSTVPHTEIGLRLTICSEFLLNEQKPVEELYRSWMRRVGGQLIGFTEFEYWYSRFKNNQFDLGYDTNLDSKEVLEAIRKKDVSTMTMEKEAPVTVVKMAKEYFKLDLQLKEKHGPQVFQPHGGIAILGVPDAIETVNDDRSGSSNVTNKENTDLGYDTSSDSKKTSKNQNTITTEASEIKNDSAVILKKEVPAEIVKRKREDLKLNYQFKKENVPHVFQNLVNRRSNNFRRSKTLRPGIDVNFTENMCTMRVYIDEVHWEKRGNDWIICYPRNYTVTITDDLERSIVDHLWFVLKNLNIKLSSLSIKAENRNSQEIDSEKMNTLLQLMFNTFDHQIQTTSVRCDGFNEGTFLSMLEHVQPGTIEEIRFNNLWKEEGKYQRRKEIVELDQWKRVKRIEAYGITPLKIDDLFQCDYFQLFQLDHIHPEDVLRVTEHYFNSVGRKFCYLYSKNESIDIEAIMDVLRSQIDGAKITEDESILPPHFCFKIVKSAKCVALEGGKNRIKIENYSNPRF